MEIVSQWTIDPHFCRPRSSNIGGSLSWDDKHECDVSDADFPNTCASAESEASVKPTEKFEIVGSENSGTFLVGTVAYEK